tara:strand:+ start:167 stop:703 length:537 start_codon:yes stop_codon:yes gene_type:complete
MLKSAAIALAVVVLPGIASAEDIYKQALCKSKTLPIDISYSEQGTQVLIRLTADDSLKGFSVKASGVDGLQVLSDINIDNVDIERTTTIVRNLEVERSEEQAFIKLEMSAVIGRGAPKTQVATIPVGELSTKQKNKRKKGVKVLKVKPRKGKRGLRGKSGKSGESGKSRNIHILNDDT